MPAGHSAAAVDCHLPPLLKAGRERVMIALHVLDITTTIWIVSVAWQWRNLCIPKISGYVGLGYPKPRLIAWTKNKMNFCYTFVVAVTAKILLLILDLHWDPLGSQVKYFSLAPKPKSNSTNQKNNFVRYGCSYLSIT
jgi:hypothetical protein